jgi:hypothetical protein
VLERLAGERPRKIVEVKLGETVGCRAAAESRDMRRYDHALAAPERVGCRQRLLLEDIGCGAGKMIAVEGGEKRRGIDETATGDIDDARAARQTSD